MDNTREKLIDLIRNTYMPIMMGEYAVGQCRVNEHEAKSIADHLIANGVTVQKWIPVSEPPKERGCYLISVKHWLDGKPVTREAFWNGADWLSCYWKKGDRIELTPRVTYWTYMPQPPKEG